MSKLVQPLAMAAMWDAVIGADDLVLALIDNTYTYSAAHEFLSDITGVLADSGPMTGVTETGPTLTADDPTVSGVGVGDIVVQGWFYVDTGTPSTSRLLVFTDKNADGTAMHYVGDGADISVLLPAGVVGTL